jgi:hypothetical protein
MADHRRAPRRASLAAAAAWVAWDVGRRGHPFNVLHLYVLAVLCAPRRIS